MLIKTVGLYDLFHDLEFKILFKGVHLTNSEEKKQFDRKVYIEKNIFILSLNYQTLKLKQTLKMIGL